MSKLGLLLQKDYAWVLVWRTCGPSRGCAQLPYIRDTARPKGWNTLESEAWAIYERACSQATCLTDLLEADTALDVAIAGARLTGESNSEALERGAHEPTPTPYVVLAELAGSLGLQATSHLLDVGCGAGRIFAYALAAALPCRVTGVELDGFLADRAAAWTRGRDRFEVVRGDALDISLGEFTHLYLFNPFDHDVLIRFLDKVQAEARHRVTLVHMSDNGEWCAYLGREGWSRIREGSFQSLPSASGGSYSIFGCPQHYSIWKLERAR